MMSILNEHKPGVTMEASEELEENASLRLQVTALREGLKAANEKYAALLRKEKDSEADACHEVDSLYSQLDLLKKTLSQQDAKHTQEIERHLADKDAAIAALNATIESYKKQLSQDSSEKERIRQENVTTRAANEEAEEHLKIAHQHLSKKVRETSELTEKLNAVQAALEKLNAQLLVKNESLAQLENSLRSTEEREQKLARELHDTKKGSEGKQAELQSQLSALKLTLEQERLEKEGMKVYEERCHQIARYWDSMGKVLWNQQPNDDFAPSMIHRASPKPYQNLIDLTLAATQSQDDVIGKS